MARARWVNKNPDELKQYTFIKQFKDSWKYSEGYRKVLVTAFILAGISGILAIIPSFLYGKIINDLTGLEFNLIHLYLILLASSYVVFHLFGRLIDHILYINNLKARNKTAQKLYNFLFGLDFEFFEKQPAGSVMNQINMGVGDFTRFNKQFYRLFLIGLFTFVFALVTLIYLEPLIFVVGFITIFIYLTWARLTDYTKIKLEYETSLAKDKEQAKIHDYLGHIQLVKLLNIKDNLMNELKKAHNIILGKESKARNYMNRIVFIQKNILDLSYVVVLFILSTSVIKGTMGIGIAVTVYALYNKFISEFKGVRQNYQDLLNSRPGMFKLAKMWKHNAKITDPKKPKKIISWDKVAFENVSFKYPSKRTITLENVSFNVKKGEKLAIVGLSGSGKSTICKLLFRMYDPDKGRIKIGDVNIKEVKSEDLYKIMKMVPQENELINATIYDNLKLGKSQKVNSKEILEVLNQAHATEFINKLPRKIFARVGPNGIKLSGGEKQRLCIARALLSKPEVLVLDEATSQLDVLTEKKVHTSLHNLGKDQTVIAITHRISSLYLFDRIIAIKDGKIVGEGTHNTLLRNPYYRKLWKQSKKI